MEFNNMKFIDIHTEREEKVTRRKKNGKPKIKKSKDEFFITLYVDSKDENISDDILFNRKFESIIYKKQTPYRYRTGTMYIVRLQPNIANKFPELLKELINDEKFRKELKDFDLVWFNNHGTISDNTYKSRYGSLKNKFSKIQTSILNALSSEDKLLFELD